MRSEEDGAVGISEELLRCVSRRTTCRIEGEHLRLRAIHQTATMDDMTCRLGSRHQMATRPLEAANAAQSSRTIA
eukprot:CAMPEP_0179419378 /NCGR_PEP_ID=MMETSP0799-20121207/8562_1 /TAXON_ID=46947 /ORGANISM="Geminigera cryophila, Strain CCMP2564" /LENGTH=74 /DNA_ID=CAMNT_0021192837 /DNA_START=21 /DNA_END=245 /DNA_ORIENTATION=-